jgi:uncharacterized protein (TIGR04255 family)
MGGTVMDPEVRYLKLERQPLTLVLAEFRFTLPQATVRRLYAMQERMQAAFGPVEEYTTQTLRLAPDGSQEKSSGWGFLFQAEDGGSLVQVEPERLVYLTTRYPRFPYFVAQCLEAVSLLEETLAPERLFRVGLRYNDAVVPDVHESLSDYLDAGLLPPAPLAAMLEHCAGHRAETQVRTQAGVLMVRGLVSQHGLATMPDISQRFQLASHADVPRDRQTAVLDFDHYWQTPPQQGEGFTRANAERHLTALHEPAREAFWRVTSEYARSEKWS